MQSLLEVNDLKVTFRTKFGHVNAVNHVSFAMKKGEVVAVVGESGSGKSVMSLTLLRLIAANGKIDCGSINLEGTELTALSGRQMEKIRGSKVSMIFQDPMSSLNPVFTIGYQMEEVLKFHRPQMSKSQRQARMIEMLQKVGMPNAPQRLKQYPHELSGGMRQRIMIAISLLCEPQLLIADEPTTALDVTIQAQIMDLLRELKDDLGTSIILITHDLGVVAGIASRVIVMYGGEMVESAPVDDIYYRPVHPYTKGLLAALPRPNMEKGALRPIPGSAPDLLLAHAGCMFFDRCEDAMECCRSHTPPIYQLSDEHQVKCFRCHPDFTEEEA